MCMLCLCILYRFIAYPRCPIYGICTDIYVKIKIQDCDVCGHAGFFHMFARGSGTPTDLIFYGPNQLRNVQTNPIRHIQKAFIDFDIVYIICIYLYLYIYSWTWFHILYIYIYVYTDFQLVPLEICRQAVSRFVLRYMKSWIIVDGLAILCDLLGMVKWPFKGLSDLQLGNQKATDWITWGVPFSNIVVPFTIAICSPKE